MRYNYLDFARGILMSMGIVLHSAQAFSPMPWRVNNETTGAVSDSSYTLYLVHSPIILAAMHLVGGIELNLYLKFSGVILFTWTTSYLIHTQIVDKMGIARLMLNGKYRKHSFS